MLFMIHPRDNVAARKPEKHVTDNFLYSLLRRTSLLMISAVRSLHRV